MPANTSGAMLVAILTPRSQLRPGQNRQMTETDGPKPVLAAMAEPEAQHPGADPKKVAEHHGYFVNQADRMDYPRWVWLFWRDALTNQVLVPKMWYGAIAVPKTDPDHA